jgi:NADH pyrophosphatase NudC (nudix superfamily)
MLGFAARYKDGALKPDGVEIEDVRWCGPDTLPGELPGNGSVARYLINQWLEGRL